MFAFDTDYDVITPSGGELLAELGIDTRAVRHALADDRARRCPRPRGAGVREVEEGFREFEREGAGERSRSRTARQPIVINQTCRSIVMSFGINRVELIGRLGADVTVMADDVTDFCRGVRRTVLQWTGLPVGVGIAETKTLAKIANRLAKTSARTAGVLDLTGSPWRDKALELTQVGDVWGIGKQFTRKLDRNGVRTALDLSRRPDAWVRNEMGVSGLRTVRELRGEDCIGFENMPQPKRTTMVSRSFGTEVRRREDVADAITLFATEAARSIRRAGLVGSAVSVFIETNRFSKGPRYAPSRSEALSPPTSNTRHIVRAALKALDRIYRDGPAYKRAGMMMLDLVDAADAPPSLFEQPDPRDDKLIEAFDTINDRLGPGSIRFGRAGQAAGWQSSSAFRSPYYTTRWSDIPVVKTGTGETG